jgi:hypothetical protein
MAKANISKAVLTSCKNAKVRSASRSCVTERPTMKSGGSLKTVPATKVGLSKLPTVVRNKMGYKEAGGATESCGPGKPKGCGYAKAQRHNKRSQAMSKVGPVLGKIAGTIATVGGLAYGAMKGKKMLENKKSGGATHPGFKAVQSKIAAKQGISKESAGAILASSARKASAKAKAANPRLKKVK